MTTLSKKVLSNGKLRSSELETILRKNPRTQFYTIDYNNNKFFNIGKFQEAKIVTVEDDDGEKYTSIEYYFSTNTDLAYNCNTQIFYDLPKKSSNNQ
jgi:hypothetical protein